MISEKDTHTDAPDTRRGRFALGRITRYVAIPTLMAIGVLVYLAFFSEKSVTQRLAYQHMIDSLNTALAAQQDTLAYYRDLNRRLSTDPELMEQVVREQYNMKRPHEDVFVVIKTDQ